MDLMYRNFPRPYDIREALTGVAAEGLYVAAATVKNGELVLMCRELPEVAD